MQPKNGKIFPPNIKHPVATFDEYQSDDDLEEE